MDYQLLTLKRMNRFVFINSFTNEQFDLISLIQLDIFISLCLFISFIPLYFFRCRDAIFNSVLLYQSFSSFFYKYLYFDISISVYLYLWIYFSLSLYLYIYVSIYQNLYASISLNLYIRSLYLCFFV